MMELIEYPNIDIWDDLCKRPELDKDYNQIAKNIFEEVQKYGDKALFNLTEKYDGIKLTDLKVSNEEFKVGKTINEDLKNSIILAKNNIEKFHSSLLENTIQKVETSPGVVCWYKNIPIEKVGLYIPGGTAPLFSTLLMLGIPAKLSGCKNIEICTPPDEEGKIHPTILFTANLLKINNIFKVGGAQAIASMSVGTETIPQVYKIFGPGNQYVTSAKLFGQQLGTSIDMPAGPSEVLVITDESSNAKFVAADLLSQAEHGPDSQVILLSINKDKILEVITEIKNQINDLPRKEIVLKSLKNSRAILLKNLKECMDFSNNYAPEHLIITTQNATSLSKFVINAGSVFLGKFSCESAGDYASGTNHTLPTNGFAKNYSGVSVNSFLKKVTFQEISEKGILNIGAAIEKMAETEKLIAHKNAVSLRLKEINES